MTARDQTSSATRQRVLDALQMRAEGGEVEVTLKALAEQLGIAPCTVSLAVRELVDAGRITRKKRNARRHGGKLPTIYTVLP